MFAPSPLFQSQGSGATTTFDEDEEDDDSVAVLIRDIPMTVSKEELQAALKDHGNIQDFDFSEGGTCVIEFEEYAGKRCNFLINHFCIQSKMLTSVSILMM